MGRRIGGIKLVNVLVIAMCLRAAVVSFGPVAQRIGADYGLSAAELGMLAALPLVTFGLVSAFVAKPARRIGFDRLSVLALLTLAVGIATRLIPAAWAMWAGTAGVGLGIGVLNVLAPAIVKRDFPWQTSFVSGLYSAAMAAAAATGIALATPLTQALHGDWRIALASSLPVVLLAIVLQLLRIGRGRRTTTDTGTLLVDGRPPRPTTRPTPLWRSPLAWAVTGYMALQSFVFYAFVNWIPSITADAGFSEAEAGFHLSVNQLLGIPGAMLVAVLMQRSRDSRVVVAGTALYGLVPVLGTLYAPSLIWLWTPMLGLVTSAYFAIAIALVGERTASSRDAARLSGMAQSVGYLVAATGPVIAGWLHDLTGGWTATIWSFAIGLVLLGLVGLVAGRDRTIAGPEQRGRERRSPEQRDEEQRDEERRDEKQRDPEQRGGEQPGREQRGPERRDREQRDPDQRAPGPRDQGRRDQVQRDQEQQDRERPDEEQDGADPRDRE